MPARYKRPDSFTSARSPRWLGGVLVGAIGLAVVVACGSSGDGSGFDDGNGSSSGTSSTGGFGSSGGDGPGGGADGGFGKDIDIMSLRIEPPDAVLTVAPGKTVTQAYRIFGKLAGESQEQDLTSRAVFYVPDNYLVGGFPLDGAPTFTSRLPATPNDPPQRGGRLTVRASVANQDGPHDVTTSLTVNVSGTSNAPGQAGNGVPGNAGTKFGGTVTGGRAPTLVYPNDGTMLPPNLRRLEVQWQGKGGTDLYEISFKSASTTIVYYATCATANYTDGACGFELDEPTYNALAFTNAGAGPVDLQIRGTKANDAGTLGVSAKFKIEFAQNRVDGGIYYWNTREPTSIVRFDFGAPSGNPENYIVDGANGVGTCPGCHALSRDGKKLVASVGGRGNGRLIFVNDVSRPRTSNGSWLTVKPDTTAGSDNRSQFAAFNPDGSRFVSMWADDEYSSDRGTIHKLRFHDGNTGAIIPGADINLGFRPNHPSWSPNGEMIAFTRVRGDQDRSSQWATQGSLHLIRRQGNGWTAPIEVAPIDQANKRSRFNPDFAPDSSFLYFTEVACHLGDDHWDPIGVRWNGDERIDEPGTDCDMDSAPRAKTWAAKPVANAARVLLENAQKLGVADGSSSHTGDTFPRSTPFQTVHRDGKLFWFTVASRRKLGFRKTESLQKLWMFAVDPEKVLAGKDGSYTGFYLPFQDMTASNHLGQWTEKVVGSQQPPPAPVPPPPPPPAPPSGGVK